MIKQKVINGKLKFYYKNKQITANEFYQLRYELRHEKLKK